MKWCSLISSGSRMWGGGWASGGGGGGGGVGTGAPHSLSASWTRTCQPQQESISPLANSGASTFFNSFRLMMSK